MSLAGGGAGGVCAFGRAIAETLPREGSFEDRWHSVAVAFTGDRTWVGFVRMAEDLSIVADDEAVLSSFGYRQELRPGPPAFLSVRGRILGHLQRGHI